MSVVYNPPGPVAANFLKSDAFVTGLIGPIGSGKSVAAVMKLLLIAKRQPKSPVDGRRHSRFAIIRNTYPELKTTTVKTWHDWVPQETGRWQSEGPPTHRIQDDEHDVEVLFVALDRPQDVRKLLSMELTAAWINEAREIPKAILDGLTGRVGRFPSSRDGGCANPQIIMDTNPPDSDHWWYRLAEEDTPIGWEFFRQPGGFHADAENLNYVNQTEETAALPLDDPARIAQGRLYYERTQHGKSQDWIKVYMHGEYGYVQDGKPMYPEYVDSLHCQEFELDTKYGLYVGVDWGLTPAALIGQKLPMGQWRWRHELVSEHMGAKQFGELLLGPKIRELQAKGFYFEGMTGDPAGEAGSQADSELTPFLILQKQGIPITPAPTNDPTIRREAVATPLTRMIDGHPGLVIHPDCRMTRKGMQGGYCLRRVQVVGDEKFKDKPDKNVFSHVCEAGQYLMLGAGEGKEVIRKKRHGARHATALSDYNILG